MLLRIKTSVSMPALVLISLITFSTLGNAQARTTQEEGKYFWLNGGFGVGSLGLRNLGLGAGMSLSLQIGQLIFSPRIAVSMASMEDAVNDIALTVGYSWKKPGSTRYFSIAGGLGMTAVEEGSTIGLAMDIQLFSTPRSFAGFGLQGFANINLQESFFGLLLCAQLGKLR